MSKFKRRSMKIDELSDLKNKNKISIEKDFR